METFICPRCGKRSMVKKRDDRGKYSLMCELCGLKRGKLPKDKKEDII